MGQTDNCSCSFWMALMKFSLKNERQFTIGFEICVKQCKDVQFCSLRDR